ncbi:MAG: hypothetical protein HY317_00515 [Acidobacteria bacterium]|nr:hypothetical protein [Acidobacteriota bacterium]
MTKAVVPEAAILQAWRTNDRVTRFLIERLSGPLWGEPVPGYPRRTVRAIAAHLHNSRCVWIKTIGRSAGIEAPRHVDRGRVAPRALVRALASSSRGVVRILQMGFRNGGALPPVAWSCFARDVVHLLAVLVAHEAHHRGQIVLLARQLGHRLPVPVTAGLWQWNRRWKEVTDR